MVVGRKQPTQHTGLIFLDIFVTTLPYSECYRFRSASSQDGQGGFLVTGGQQHDNEPTAEVYRGGKWTRGPDLPWYRFDHCQVLLGNTVYVTGGFASNSGQPNYGHYASTLKLTEDGNWVEVGSLAVARDDFACAVHDGKIFAIGGNFDGHTPGDAYLSSVEIFDPASETWTFGPEFPQGLAYAQAFSWDGHLWVMGGNPGDGSGYNDILYRLEENVWKNTGIIVQENGADHILPAQILDKNIIDC